MSRLLLLWLSVGLAVAGCGAGNDDETDDGPKTSSVTSAVTGNFATGSLIIPLDTTSQDAGALRAYGLVYQLLRNNIPVQWAISNTKAAFGNDFTVTAPASVKNRETGTALALPINYRGGPFIIDSADRAAALPIIDAWLASDTVTVVHDVTGAFTANINKTLTAAPRIAMLQDGFESIAIANFNAAGITDSANNPWATTSPDILTEAAVAGATTTSHADGALRNSDGTTKYCHLTSMHYNATAQTPEVVAEVRSWLALGATNHAFMQCQATATFENAAGGLFLTTAGIVDDGTAPTPLTIQAPTDPLTQVDGALQSDTGAVDSIGLATGSTFKSTTRTLVSQTNAATGKIMWMTGNMDGVATNGKVTYLTGHDYSTATPLSANPLTNGVKVMFDSLFESGCSDATGQPKLVVTKTSNTPATKLNQFTYTIAYTNTGTGVANAATISDTIPTGTTYVSSTGGGTNSSGTVSWSVGNIAAGGSGSVTVTVGATVDGGYANTATMTYSVGVTSKTVTSTTATTTRDTAPPDTTITTKPTDPSDATQPQFDFTATQTGSTFECKLDAGAFATCTGPFTTPVLALGTHTFQVRATDPAGNVDATPASYTWRVNATPVANADTTTTLEDTAKIVSVLANDTGLGDGPITLVASDPPHGTAVVNAGNTITYTPDPNYNGSDSFTYTITDNDGQTSTATVTVTITPVNDPPVAVPDSAGTATLPIDIPVLANDTDVEGDPLTVTAVSTPTSGTATINPNGTIHYVPANGFTGTATFTYSISDGHGGTASTTVSVTVGVDTDGDGLPDAYELQIGTDPNDADSDDDGVLDGAEPAPGVDSDGDGLINALDPDSDNDGLYDGTEMGVTTPDASTDLSKHHFIADADPTTTTNPLDPDTDHGGVRDGVEDTNRNGKVDAGERDPKNAADDANAATDTDGDGLPDATEILIGSNPNDPDTDDDGIPDGAEANWADDTDGDGLINVLDPDSDNDGLFDGTETGVTVAGAGTDVTKGHFVADADPATKTGVLNPDTDHGGVMDGAEDTNRNGKVDPGELNPLVKADDVNAVDTDHDGLPDAVELALGTNPNDADSDDDGVIDGKEPNWSDDSDGDGLINALDPDSDDDGLFDGTELGITVPNADTDVSKHHFKADADPSTRTGPLNPDTDHGGIHDGAEDTNRDGKVEPGEGDPNKAADDSSLLDTDHDGLPDAVELAIGTNPNDPDSDDDGVIDGNEPNWSDDTDGDGLINPLDPDSDNDGLFDGTEAGITMPSSGTDLAANHFIADADPTTHTKVLNPDTDHGGIKDGAEDFNRNGRIDPGELDPNLKSDDLTSLDTDGDGLPDALEIMIGSNPNDADSDDDGVIDGAEPNFRDDTDGDGLINVLDPDSDNDGLFDGTELGITVPDPDTDLSKGHFIADADPTTTTGPLNPDTDHGGVKDGDEDTNHDGKIDPGERDPNNPADDVLVDTDGDGIPDATDNCPLVANPSQADQDHDGIGDACDPDKDGNGFNDDIGVSGGGCDAGGGGNGALVAMLMIGAALLRRRKAVAIVVIAGAVRMASAQPAMEPANFGVERFRISSDREGLFDVEWAESRGNMAVDAALWLGYADDPLVVYSGSTTNRTGELVHRRMGGSLSVSVSPRRWLQIGLDLPLVLDQDRPASNTAVAPMGLASLSSFGTSNLRLIPKLTLVRQAQAGVSIAIIPAVTIPTRSSSDAYFDDSGFGFAPELAVSRRWVGWRLGVDAGYRMRKRAVFLNEVVDDELFAHAGLGYQFGDTGGPPLGIDVTFSGATAAASPFEQFNNNSLEGLLGATYWVTSSAQLFAAGGAGLRQGYGTPDWRGLAGVRIGLGDTRHEEARALPPPIEKPIEVAPPIVTDRDGDGIPDATDKCPDEAEDKDGFEDGDGCPDLDNDADGTPDATDACPMVAGPADNKGCPEPDRDGDGVIDRLDNCPDEAGPADNAGCAKKQLVKISNDKLEIIQSVYFKTDKAVIESRSFELLDNVASVLASHPTLMIQVEGHTDSQGNAAYNKGLSQRRAEAVVAYLVKKGVTQDRLTPKGFGAEVPIADNRTKDGRSQNRRVVFTITGGTGVSTSVQGAGNETK